MLPKEAAQMSDHGRVGVALGAHDGLGWKCHTTIEKWNVPDFHGNRAPYERVEVPGNLLTYGGADVLWGGILKKLSTSSTKFQYFDSTAHAAILVGDSSAAAVNTQTDLQASSGAAHRYVLNVDATYPKHTTGASTAANAQIQFKATFTSSQGNFAWHEWGVGNKKSQAKAYPGRLLNRKVTALGTKTSAGVWALTVTLTLS